MNSPTQKPEAKRVLNLSIQEMALFAVLGTMMYLSKILMEALPNCHLIATLIVAYTLVFKKKAVVIIYVFVFLTGLFAGFAMWWVPYLYIWLPLWLVALKLPDKQFVKWSWLYMVVCGVHGLLYGTLYAPSQAIMFGMNFKQMCAWIVAGLPWDIVHAISNTVVGLLVVPIAACLQKLVSHTRGF